MGLKWAIIFMICIAGVLIIFPLILGNAVQAGQNLPAAAIICLVILGWGTLSESKKD